MTIQAAVALLVASAIGGTSFAAIPHSAKYEQLLDRFFLVRPSNYVGPCRSLSLREAIVIFRVGTHRKALTLGDEFFVIDPPSRLIRGVLTAIVKECPWPAFIVDNVVLGLLTLDSPIHWIDSSDSTLGIKAPKPLPAQIGSIVPLTNKRELQRYLEIARARIPQNHKIYGPDFWTAVRITIPRSKMEYVFVTVAHDDPQNPLHYGSHWTGFFFIPNRIVPVLVWQEAELERVISVTDLNDDGIYQILTRGPGAHYDVRLFDGKKLSEPLKTLYIWID